MTKGLISIFVLPHEIDNLHLTLYNFRRNAELLSDNVKYGFDITLSISSTLTDWTKSKLPQEYFTQKFRNITDTLLGDWCQRESIKITYDDSILGCVSQRRHSLQFLDKYDFTLWMDTDLFFGDKFLECLGTTVDKLQSSGIDYFIVTPQVTRQWDTSWDVVVNKKLLQRPLNDNLVADVFKLGLDTANVTVGAIDGFKAAGGWGTAISNKLLRLTGIPDSLGHYGLEDTYVLTCAQMLQAKHSQIKPQQFVMDGMLVCENHSQQTTEYLQNVVCNINRKDEFRQIATQNFNKELGKFYNENILSHI